MLFNSIPFAIFFPITVLIYFVLAGRYRWLFLLAASYGFYMAWRVEYIILILISTSIDYYASRKMASLDTKPERRKYLYLSLIANLGLLFTFKYLNFFQDTLSTLTGSLGISTSLPTSNLILPIGISFYTFQTLSYTIDVYNGKIQPERHIGIFALFVAFFPQLVAGPIERPKKLLPQLNRLNILGNFDYDRVTDGLRLMAWGFFKKIVIADRLAIYVNAVYNHPTDYKGLVVAIATIFFAFQIYCDFSGYSDIAIGAARILGVNLTQNFRRPYLATSIPDFWNRWHITLSTWFRDYLYIPLGGNRVSVGRWHINILIVFLLSGLWHGANWTFAIWGLIHAFAYLLTHWVGRFITRYKTDHQVEALPFPRFLYILQIMTMFAIVCFGWIFFRANSVHDAFVLLRNMFDLQPITSFWDFRIVLEGHEFLLALALITFLMTIEILQSWVDFSAIIQNLPTPARFAFYYVAIMTITLFGIFGEASSDFVYFQF